VIRFVAAAIVVLLTWGAATVSAQTTAEATLKAAFLLNFIRFVEWPRDVLGADAPITTCMVDAPVVAALLTQVATGRSINGHHIVVSNLSLDGPLRTCNVVYVSGVDAAATRRLVRSLEGAPVFTVSDFERFAAFGGITNFIADDTRLRFAVNVEAAKRARLRLSAPMLALATIVSDTP
jgi:hypothetical protein